MARLQGEHKNHGMVLYKRASFKCPPKRMGWGWGRTIVNILSAVYSIVMKLQQYYETITTFVAQHFSRLSYYDLINRSETERYP